MAWNQPQGRQRGAFLLAVAAACAIGIAATLATTLAGPAARLARDRASDRSLALAREALVAHAAGRPIDKVVGPGYLPCPDLDDDGWAESTCGSQNGGSGQAQRLGRLPWKTLGLPDLRDGTGERLWYAVSSKPKGLLNCTVSEACLDMGPDAAIGTISVRDATGTYLHDGRVDDLRRAQAGGALAVVFAPGAPLPREGRLQERGCAPGECDPQGRCLATLPARPAKCDPRNYLDQSGLEDNAAFVDRNDQAGRSANGDGFIQGPVREAGVIVVNDRLAALGYDDVMPAVMRRVAREVLHCLHAHARAHGAYPAPAPACRQSVADPVLAWQSHPGARFGRVPALSNPDCRLGAGPGFHWWLAWRAQVFYALAPGALQAVDASGAPLGARDLAVVVAGAPLAGQSHSPGTLAVPGHWLEGAHVELVRLDAVRAPDCAVAQASAPCTAVAPCNRIVLAGRRAQSNDVAVAWP